MKAHIAGDGQLGGYAHKGGYYLHNGHWHKINKDKPAPKSAPKASHPEAAGAHAPAKHLTDDQWSALKLPESNTNAPTYNSQLDKLKEMSEAGHVTGIVGSGYGVNTYGKKLAVVANHLLEKHGSAHKVAPGQKAGEHPAVQGSVDAVVEHKDAVIKEAIEHLKEDANQAGMPAGEVAEDKALVQKLESAHAVKLPQIPMPSAVQLLQPTGLKADSHGALVQKIKWLYESGNLAELEKIKDALFTPAYTGAILYKGKGAKGIVKYLDATIADLGGKAAKAPVAPAPSPVAAVQPVSTSKVGMTSPAADDVAWMTNGAGIVTHNGNLFLFNKEEIKDYVATGPSVFSKIPPAYLEKMKVDASALGPNGFNQAAAKKQDLHLISSPEDLGDYTNYGFNSLNADLRKFTTPSSTLFQKLEAAFKSEKISAAPEVWRGIDTKVDVKPGQVLLEPAFMSTSLDKAKAEKFGKGGTVFRIKNAEGLYIGGDESELLINRGAKLRVISSEDHKDYRLVTVDIDIPSASPNSMLSQIPWGKMYLPSTNSNAGPNNKKVDQIKKLAEAGDVAGLEAMKFGSNNYAKKQALLAQTAIAALKGSQGKPQAVAPSPASAASNGPKDGDTKPAADGGMLVFKDGYWRKQVTDAPGKQWDYSDNNEGMSNAETLMVGTKNNSTLYIVKTYGGYEVGELDAGGDYVIEPKFYSSLANVVKYLQTGGYKDIVPSNSDLAKFGDANWTPAAVSTAPSSPTVLSVSANGIESMDSWTQTGPQGGSNPGGKFKDLNGKEWYCKFPVDEDHAKSELLAANLYALAGVAGQDAKLITRNGKVGIASRWMGGTKESAGNLAKAEGVHSGFAVDAWLSNWDVIGAANDNLLLDANGKAVRIDAGGSLGYRAMGKKKTLTGKVDDIKNMLNPSVNPSASAVFGSMTEADITASVAKVAAISDSAIFDMVNEYGAGSLEEKKKLAATLIARKKDLIKQYPGSAKKKKKPVFDASKITAPPDFMDWGGSGSPGPSSKYFVNKSNNDAVQAIYAEAKKGSVPAIQKLQLDTYDKNTGKVIGKVSAPAHPSQHVKGYAQQAINEINYQLNPPNVFQFDAGHPLQVLNAAYPAINNKAAAAAPTVAKFLLVGDPGAIKLEDFGLPPLDAHVNYGGTVSIDTYKTQALAAFKKMPKTQIEALKSYTGSGYHDMNDSLWSGNPNGEAIAAATALKTLSHDIAPGTVLSRKLTVTYEPELKELLGSVGKVLQENRIISTSISPDIWGGNIHLKLIVGPGVKGLYVGEGANPDGGAISVNKSEQEIILPPNTRLVVTKITSGAKMIDKEGFDGEGSDHIIEAVILPTT